MADIDLQGDTPEDLLDSTWQGLDGVLGLSSSQTNEFRSGERESGGNEDSAEATEAVTERAWVLPRLRALVRVIASSLRSTTEDTDERDDHEDDDGTELQKCSPELLFGKTKSAKHHDERDDDEEDGDPDSDIYVWYPVCHDETTDR